MLIALYQFLSNLPLHDIGYIGDPTIDDCPEGDLWRICLLVCSCRSSASLLEWNRTPFLFSMNFSFLTVSSHHHRDLILRPVLHHRSLYQSTLCLVGLEESQPRGNWKTSSNLRRNTIASTSTSRAAASSTTCYSTMLCSIIKVSAGPDFFCCLPRPISNLFLCSEVFKSSYAGAYSRATSLWEKFLRPGLSMRVALDLTPEDEAALKGVKYALDSRNISVDLFESILNRVAAVLRDVFVAYSKQRPGAAPSPTSSLTQAPVASHPIAAFISTPPSQSSTAISSKSPPKNPPPKSSPSPPPYPPPRSAAEPGFGNLTMASVPQSALASAPAMSSTVGFGASTTTGVAVSHNPRRGASPLSPRQGHADPISPRSPPSGVVSPRPTNKQ